MTVCSPARHKCLAVLPVVLLGAISACSGGGSSSSTPSVTFEGEWEGTWVGSAPGSSGAVTVTLAPAEADLGGTAVFQGHPCFTTCSVQCQVNGERLSATFYEGPLQMRFEGACSGPHHGSGHHQHHHAGAMTGTYEVLGGPCAGERGSLQLTWRSEAAPPAGGPMTFQVGEVIVLEGDAVEPTRIPVYASVESEE